MANNNKYSKDRNSKSDKKDYRTKGRGKPNSNRKVPETGDKPIANRGGGALSSLNDLSWYTKYPELLMSTAQIPFPNKPGMTTNFGTAGSADPSHTPATIELNYTVPGVARLSWFPAFNTSSFVTDPASIAAREIYSKVRAKFSSSLDADAPDFIVYLGALDSIFSYIGALKRIYRLLDAYSPYNYATPNCLLESLGLEPQDVNDLKIDKANFNFAINQLVRASRKFMMPNTMDLFSRHYWLNDNVYVDADSPSAQFYTFVQSGFYMYQSQQTPQGLDAAGLLMVAAPWKLGHTEPIDVACLLEFGEQLIGELSAWDDCYTISGYLMRAYEGAPQFIVEELPLEVSFAPAYVPEVLSQIENSFTVAGGDYEFIENFSGLNVSQDPTTNSIIYKPSVNIGTTGYRYGMEENETFLSLRTDSPTAADVVIATRLHATVDVDGPDSDRRYIICGTEIPIGWRIYVPNPNTGLITSFGVAQHAVWDFRSPTNYDEDAFKWLRATALLSAFDWAPFITALPLAEESQSVIGSHLHIFGEVRNLTKVTRQQLADIHRVCTFSELNAYTE